MYAKLTCKPQLETRDIRKLYKTEYIYGTLSGTQGVNVDRLTQNKYNKSEKI